MRSLPGDLFNCMSFIILSRVFLCISYLVGIMFLQYILSNTLNHFAHLVNLVSLCQIFCQNHWTLSLVEIFSYLILLPLKSWYTPFGLLKNLQLIEFLLWFFCVFSFLQVAFLTLVFIESVWNQEFFVWCYRISSKFSLDVFNVSLVTCPIVFLRKLILFSMFVIHFGGLCVFGSWLVFSFKSSMCSLALTAAIYNNMLISRKHGFINPFNLLI